MGNVLVKDGVSPDGTNAGICVPIGGLLLGAAVLCYEKEVGHRMDAESSEECAH